MRGAVGWSVLAMAVVLVRSVPSGAGCNMIPARDAAPGFVALFFGDTGTINTPFFAPGDKIGLAGRNGGAPAPIGEPADQLRTVFALKPTNVSAKTPVRLLIVEREGERACDEAMMQACRNAVGASVPVACAPLSATDYNVVDGRLSIALPAFDDAATPTLNGPVLVAVTKRDEQPPCAAAASQSCGDEQGDLKSTIACIDALYEPPTDDKPKRSELFSSLTLLPEENDFAAACENGDPGCTTTEKSRYVRYAVDGGGNVLVPMLWGNLNPCIDQKCKIPVHGEVARPEWTWLPPNETSDPDLNRNLASFTRDGRPNHPKFIQETPGLTRSRSVGGTTDLRQSVLRIARHYGLCANDDTSRCSLNADCAQGVQCSDKCADKDGLGDCNWLTCGDTKCGKTHSFAGTDGILVRHVGPNEKGFCQEDRKLRCPEKPCTGDCVAYALHAEDPISKARPMPLATPDALTAKLAGKRRQCAVGISPSQVAVIVGTGPDTQSCDAPLALLVASVCTADICADSVKTASLPPGNAIPNSRLALGEGRVRFFQGPVATVAAPGGSAAHASGAARYANLRVFDTETNTLQMVSCAKLDDPLHDPLLGDGGPDTTFIVPEGRCVDHEDVLAVPSICRPNLPAPGDCPPPARCEPHDVVIAADLRDIVQGRTCAERGLGAARVRHRGKGLGAWVVPAALDASAVRPR